MAGELNINDVLGKVLENPEALGGIMKLLKSDAGLGGVVAGAEKDAGAAASESAPPLTDRDSENRIRLLGALKPYLGEGRRDKVEYILKLLRIMQLASSSGLIKL